ncbi:hypothetical protein SAMN05216226_10535 [Halovenus aranensis]|uniref:Uncharacterized protein n=2 Tax=Halovenus aranensis TaxID=890420 RepID=A0A1G8UQZ2_9EURY|nr:hypothetical protein SAMN05216226_10535 [Halovenus aranensis]
MCAGAVSTSMLDQLAATCENERCNRPLTEEECMLVYQTEYGQRRAYECHCGTVTVTVGRRE